MQATIDIALKDPEFLPASIPVGVGDSVVLTFTDGSTTEHVVEGVGDHGCEYMTGGRAIILGETGRNFGAGMSGGIAYVLDESGRFPSMINNSMLDLDPLDDDDVEYIQRMLRNHFHYTRSQRADSVLRKWDSFAPKFIKVFPQEYKQALARLAAEAGE